MHLFQSHSTHVAWNYSCHGHNWKGGYKCARTLCTPIHSKLPGQLQSTVISSQWPLQQGQVAELMLMRSVAGWAKLSEWLWSTSMTPALRRFPECAGAPVTSPVELATAATLWPVGTQVAVEYFRNSLTGEVARVCKCPCDLPTRDSHHICYVTGCAPNWPQSTQWVPHWHTMGVESPG